MEAPVPLLTVDDAGKFQVGKEATDILAKIQGKIEILFFFSFPN